MLSSPKKLVSYHYTHPNISWAEKAKATLTSFSQNWWNISGLFKGRNKRQVVRSNLISWVNSAIWKITVSAPSVLQHRVRLVWIEKKRQQIFYIHITFSVFIYLQLRTDIYFTVYMCIYVNTPIIIGKFSSLLLIFLKFSWAFKNSRLTLELLI